MYCKNCGKQLRKEARFCDYCGQSTNNGGTQRNTVQKRTTGTQTRNASKTVSQTTRSRAEYEKNKKRRELERKKAQKNRRIIAFLILLAIAGSAVLGFAVHNQTKKELEKDKQQVENTLAPENGDASEETTDTQEADSTEKADTDSEPEDEDVKVTSKPTSTAKASNKASDSEEDTKTEKTKDTDGETAEDKKTEKDFEAVSEECNVYRDERMNNIRCPYPKTFEQGSKSNKNTILSLVDPLNDGAMMICTDDVSSGQSASTLMKDYADGVGGKILSSRAGDGWYTISFERNNKINHRKAVIADGKCVYYDFSYDSDSGEKGSYEQYVEYIDYYLEKELESVTKEEKDKE